jgi:hypothetical protein
MLKWKHKYPNKPGVYWFVGERWARNSYQKEKGEAPEIELILVEVSKCINGLIVIGEGQFLYEKEFGDYWYFVKAVLPELPGFPFDAKFVRVLQGYKK